MSSRIEIKSSVVDRLYLSLMAICQSVQVILGGFLWYVFIVPLVGTFKTNNGEFDKYVADESKIVQKIIWKTTQALMHVEHFISGMFRSKESLERLLVWNEMLPLIGYDYGKASHEIRVKKNHPGTNVGSAAGNHVTISHPKKLGHLRILEKVYNENDGRVKIRLVWTSGDSIGRTFEVPHDYTTKEGLEAASRDEISPTYLYFPPGWLITLIEIVSWTSAVLVFLMLVADAAEKFFKIFKEMV